MLPLLALPPVGGKGVAWDRDANSLLHILTADIPAPFFPPASPQGEAFRAFPALPGVSTHVSFSNQFFPKDQLLGNIGKVCEILPMAPVSSIAWEASAA